MKKGAWVGPILLFVLIVSGCSSGPTATPASPQTPIPVSPSPSLSPIPAAATPALSPTPASSPDSTASPRPTPTPVATPTATPTLIPETPTRPLSNGVPLIGTIRVPGERNKYALTQDEIGPVTLKVAGIPAGKRMELASSICSATFDAYNTETTCPQVPPGTYDFLAYGSNASGDFGFTYTITADTSRDNFAETKTAAHTLLVGGSRPETIYPKGDHDVYIITQPAEHSMTLKVTGIPPGLQLDVSGFCGTTFDSNRNVSRCGRPPIGFHYLDVHGTNASTDFDVPYTIAITTS